MTDPDIRIASWTRGSDADRRSGLLGYVSVRYGGLLLDGITVRRTADGRVTLSLPERRDRLGRRHPYIRPIDDEARVRFERQVLGDPNIVEAIEW